MNISRTEIIDRTRIRFADYNPRKKSDFVVKEIIKNFKKVGYLGGIVWNELTGNIVSGHKRLEALDVINKYNNGENDYQIQVEVVTLDDKTEKEQNIYMNSKSVQGQFDYEILGSLINEIDINLAGLSESDMHIIEAYMPKNDEIELIKNDIGDINRTAEEKKDLVKQAKKDFKENLKESQKQFNAYVTLSFSDYKTKEEFLENFGFEPNITVIKGEEFINKL